MEKKESTTSSHVGICQKLFNAFNPAHRPHSHLNLHHQGPGAAPNPSPTQPGMKEPSPQKALPAPVKPGPLAPDQKKPYEAIAPKAEPKPTIPPPPPTSVAVQKVPNKLGPKAAATPQPLPQPAPPQGAAAATEKPKKNINEKVEEYIKRTKERLRTVSGIGRTPTSK
ncbi:alpha carbonic anhydrase 8 [Cocos nucifera]|uniref:Alpha carbonic anhydrase 8 n=1 Tax=Cocos nucifera TaxID=13894 RepID=A0A8K0IM66_COCNU|nr:alpha carbonic anhydrase 8 [Cocos nucifera]